MRKTAHFISLLITPDHCKVTLSEGTIKKKKKEREREREREREEALVCK